MDAELLKLLGPYGFGGVIVWMLWRFLSRLTDRGITAFDKLSDRVDGHGKTLIDHANTENAHHTKVSDGLSRLAGQLDGILDERERSTPIEGVPHGYYGHHSRPKTNPQR